MERTEWHRARVENGKVLFNDLQRVNNHLQTLNGVEVYVTFVPIPKKRTGRQNQYFHGPLIEDVQRGLLEQGFTDAIDPQWVKDLLKRKFLYREDRNEMTGEVVSYVRKTSSLTKEEFSVFISAVVQWAQEFLGVAVRDPQDYLND